MKKNIQLILLLLWTIIPSVHCQQSYTEFKNSIGKIELVKVLPTLTDQHKKLFRTINFYSPQSIITNTGEKYINENLITEPVLVDSALTDSIINLVYADSSTLYRTRCYNPRHGILLWDTNGKYLGFVEICFECRGIRTTTGIPEPQNLPYEIYERLELLFKSFGLVDEEPVEKDE